MARVHLQQLSFTYNDKRRPVFIKDLSLSLDSGWVSIIGPNGAGKSTLLRLMNGDLKPDAGQAFVCGMDAYHSEPIDKAKCMTTIHQQRQVLFPFTCYEMISHGLYAKGKKYRLDDGDYDRVIKALEETELTDKMDIPVTELSGGERQRLYLATALVQAPEVFFIDEGFSALDIRYKGKMMGLLKRKVDEENLLVISIIHDMNIASRISDEVILMDEGNVLYHGLPSEVMTQEKMVQVYGNSLEFQSGLGFQIKL